MTKPTPREATAGGDAERDAWLHHALRHAPDAELAAPAALSDAILREARSAVGSGAGERWPGATKPHRVAAAQGDRAGRRRGLARRLAHLWDALARPPVAAGVASLVVATLVGMLGWDRPLEDTTSGANPAADATGVVPAARDPAAATTAVAPAARAPAAAATRQPMGLDGDRERSTDRRQALEERRAPNGVPSMPVQRLGNEARSRASPEEAKALSRQEPEDSVGRTALPAPVPSAPQRSPPVTSSAKAGPTLPPLPSPAQHPRLSARVPSGDRLDTEAAGAPPRSPRSLTDSQSEPGTPQPFPAAPTPEAAKRADAMPRLEAAPPAAPPAPFAGQEGTSRTAPAEPPSAAPSALDSPLDALRNAIVSEPQHWTWARAGAQEQPLDAAFVDWLAQVDAARNAAWFGVGGSWKGQLRESLRPGSASPTDDADAAVVQVFRDGRLAAMLRLGAGALELSISPAAGVAVAPRQWRAPLAPERARRLRADLP